MMRLYLLKEYPNNKTWADRVKVMSDKQVIGIYNRLVAEGTLHTKGSK